MQIQKNKKLKKEIKSKNNPKTVKNCQKIRKFGFLFFFFFYYFFIFIFLCGAGSVKI